VRKLLTIRWLGFHILTIGCVGLFCILGHWQWDVGGQKRGSIRNYAYGLEWWVFALILLVLWWRLIRQELRGGAQESKEGGERVTGEAYRGAPRFRVPAPQVTAHVDDTEDPAMAAYNRYLASLHDEDVAAGDPA
jgi:hypothetical protein